MGRAREKKADIHVEVMNGPDWALSVLHGVVSSVLSSSVVLCWSQRDWLQLGSGCDSSTGSVGPPSPSVGSVFSWNMLFLRQWTAQGKKKKSTEWAKALTTLMLLGCKVPVCIICCIGRCLSGWMLCLLWVSVFVWCWCELCPAAMCQLLFCLIMGGQAVKVGGRGPSVAQCPELAAFRSVRCLRGSCAGMQEWGMGGISPTDRHVEWVTCRASPCFSGDFWPSVWKCLCPHWRSGCSRWWLLSGDVVSMYLRLPLAGQILVNVSWTCQDHFFYYGEKV